ncbi:hypothetical protein OG897_27330 [Streptomyces sp. NBC_00237]|uniref:hypothetical protein n=1 Tax=Streptomyces sp. NBC_00237 TaxID=2975687 RepID=UPI0022505566|nr:hypothetical protein [Streptomyces sp. NBC_00237]MCX5205156.1 hypothetical protein [Streptomyces sp. NBC_00237]
MRSRPLGHIAPTPFNRSANAVALNNASPPSTAARGVEPHAVAVTPAGPAGTGPQKVPTQRWGWERTR